MSTWISDILDTVDTATGVFITNQAGNAEYTQYLTSAWRFAAIIAITIIGFNFIFGGQSTVRDMVMQLFKIVFVLMVITVAVDFNVIFYHISTVWPGEVETHIMRGQGASATSVNELIDNFFEKGMAVAKEVHGGQGWIKGFFGVLFSVITVLVVFLLTAAALMMVILSKMVVAIMLSLGPLFVIGLLFERTRPLFEGWFRNLMSFALIPIVLYALLGLVLAIIEGPMNTAATQDVEGFVHGVKNIGPFILISIVGIALVTQVMGIAAQIAGGLAMNTSAGLNWAARSMGQGAGKLGRKGAGAAGRAGRKGARGAGRTAKGWGREIGQGMRDAGGDIASGARRAAPVVQSAGHNAYQGMARLARTARSRIPTRTKPRSIGTD